MENIDYATFNKLKERMKNKFPVLLNGYIQDAKKYIETAQNNIPNGDIKQAVEAVHSLKSSSGLLGIVQVHKAAETLEYAGKDLLEKGENNAQSLQPITEYLHTAFSNVEPELQKELNI